MDSQAYDPDRAPPDDAHAHAQAFPPAMGLLPVDAPSRAAELAAVIERALARWRRSAVKKAVLRARAEDRLHWRLEAESIADAVRASVVGGWAPPPSPGAAPAREPVARPAIARAAAEAAVLNPPVPPPDAGDPLQPGERAVASEAADADLDAATALSLTLDTRVAIDAHVMRLRDKAMAERSLLGEALLSLRGLFASLSDGILFLDRAGVVVDANRSICEVTGLAREHIVGRLWDEVWPQAQDPRLQGLYRRVQEEGRAESAYGLCYRPPGAKQAEVFDLVVAPRVVGGRILGTVSIVHYRTEQAHLEQRLLDADKMASFGRLAAGIAHEFRNLLAGVRALAELGLAGAEEPAAAFRKVVRVADQASDVAHGLLAFARRGPRRLDTIDARALFADVLDLALSARERARFEVEVAVGKDMPRFVGDRGALTQALVNLVMNAAQAMPREGGRIVLSARPLPPARASADAAPPADGPPAGDEPSGAGEGAPAARVPRVELAVEDSGPGIPDELRERVFEPFFTLREGDEFGEGAGTGLGLPTVRAIAERHGGTVTARAGREGGSRFAIRIPRRAAEAAPELDRAPRESDRPSGAFANPAAVFGALAPAGRDRPRALVVDDERVLRQIVRTVLERAGLDVATARSVGIARRKLAVAARAGRPFHVALLDLVVPGMRGPRTLRALRRRYPELKLAILTGRSLSDDALEEVLGLSDAFLEKPFQIGALVERIHALVGAASDEPGADAQGASSAP